VTTQTAEQRVAGRHGRPYVSVVVPLLNEAATVAPLYERLVAALAEAGLDAEMIFVDDGSTDATFELLAGLHAGD
jgi:glycosyltransferase involved in cell wall biosynthesis